jgi:hypothetical protein
MSGSIPRANSERSREHFLIASERNRQMSNYQISDSVGTLRLARSVAVVISGLQLSHVAERCPKRLISPAILLFLVMMTNCAHAADLFSVRCEGGLPLRSYFATFDVDAKTVVLETPSASVEPTFGINTYSGEIVSSEGGKVEVILSLLPGTLGLILDRNQKTMTWPGIGDATFRPTLIHACTITPPRSILSFRVRDPIQQPVTVRCEDTGFMYFTMDAASKQALFERGKEGRSYQGEVTDAGQDEMTLTINFDVPRRVVWSKSRQTITIEGIESDAQRPRTVLKCQDIAPRTMIEFYRMSRR